MHLSVKVIKGGRPRPRPSPSAIPCRMSHATRRGVIAAAFAAFLSVAHTARAEQADYLLLYSVSSYTLLNKYEQPATAEERGAFLAGAPMRIEENKTTLGDGLTPALRGYYRGTTWYLQRDENGKLLGDRSAFRQVLNGCTEVGDTMEVSRGGAILFSTRPDGSGGQYLAKGERIYRVFRHGGRSYSLRMGSSPAYGWCSGTGLTPVTNKASFGQERAMDDDLRRQIGTRIDEVNALYAAVFKHLGALSGNSKSAPSWVRAPDQKANRWTLNAPYNRTGELDNSTQVLVRDLRSMLVGRALDVHYENGTLSIEPRKPDTL
jgi:hypothetical protein